MGIRCQESVLCNKCKRRTNHWKREQTTGNFVCADCLISSPASFKMGGVLYPLRKPLSEQAVSLMELGINPNPTNAEKEASWIERQFAFLFQKLRGCRDHRSDKEEKQLDLCLDMLDHDKFAELNPIVQERSGRVLACDPWKVRIQWDGDPMGKFQDFDSKDFPLCGGDLEVGDGVILAFKETPKGIVWVGTPKVYEPVDLLRRD